MKRREKLTKEKGKRGCSGCHVGSLLIESQSNTEDSKIMMMKKRKETSSLSRFRYNDSDTAAQIQRLQEAMILVYLFQSFNVPDNISVVIPPPLMGGRAIVNCSIDVVSTEAIAPTNCCTAAIQSTDSGDPGYGVTCVGASQFFSSPILTNSGQYWSKAVFNFWYSAEPERKGDGRRCHETNEMDEVWK